MRWPLSESEKRDMLRKYLRDHSVERDDCLVWTGRTYRHGYGWVPTLQTQHRKAAHPGDTAHRVAYRLAHGSIPKGHHLHHTCRNKSCIKVAHLVPITPAKHRLLHVHVGPRMRTQLASRCNHGHLYTPENTYFYNGGRACKQCRFKRTREHYLRNRKQILRKMLRKRIFS